MFFAQQQQHHHLSSNSISISSVTTKRIRVTQQHEGYREYAVFRTLAFDGGKQSRRTFSTGRAAVVRAAGAADGGDGNVKFANNKAEWDAVTGGNDGLIAVQISTKTCGPCKVIYPTFVGLSEEFAEKATFVKIMGDTDTESRALMKEWGVRVVPLFMLWKNGEKIAEWSGAKPDVLRENVTSAM